MKFKLDFNIPSSPIIDGFQTIGLLGSCFAEHQAAAFKNSGFNVISNPFGIVYNPIAMQKQLERIAFAKEYVEDDFIDHKGSYFSLEHHGHFKFETPQQAVEECNLALVEARRQLVTAQTVVITLGTSIVFRHKETQSVVSNCHSLPNQEFETLQLSVDQCKEALQDIEQHLRELNKEVIIVYSVSPVRHIRSGLVENTVSKSILRTALHEMSCKHYFPSYEIFIDELRDYRFSAEDLTHPNAQAQAYIWDAFKKCYLSNNMQDRVSEIEQFRKFEAHRPIHNPKPHKIAVVQKAKELKAKYPEISL